MLLLTLSYTHCCSSNSVSHRDTATQADDSLLLWLHRGCLNLVHASTAVLLKDLSALHKVLNDIAPAEDPECLVHAPTAVLLRNMSALHQVLDDIAPAEDPDAMEEDGDAAAEADLSKPEAKQKLLYCERFVEFLTDLLSQLPTRRFVRTLLEDRAILTKCRMSALFQHPGGECICCFLDVTFPSAVHLLVTAPFR